MSANPPVRPPDPIVTSRFKVEFGNWLSGYFTSVTLANSTVDPVPYNYVDGGGRPGFSTQPGLKNKSGATIVLKRALNTDPKAWQWHKMVLDGKVDDCRTNGSISILSADGQNPLVSFTVLGAWPTKVEFGSGLVANANSAGEESITLACESFFRQ